MPARQVKRTVVYRMAGAADGRRQTLFLDEGRETARVHLPGWNGAVYMIPTGSVEWDGDVPLEVWVPADRYGEWRMSEW